MESSKQDKVPQAGSDKVRESRSSNEGCPTDSGGDKLPSKDNLGKRGRDEEEEDILIKAENEAKKRGGFARFPKIPRTPERKNSCPSIVGLYNQEEIKRVKTYVDKERKRETQEKH